MALLQFTVPSLLGQDAARLLEAFGGGTASTRSREDALVASQRVGRAKRIMAPFVLRRKKSQVRGPRSSSPSGAGMRWVDHRPAMASGGRRALACTQVLSQLPPKTDHVQFCALPPRQANIYGTMIRESRDRIRASATGTLGETVHGTHHGHRHVVAPVRVRVHVWDAQMVRRRRRPTTS